MNPKKYREKPEAKIQAALVRKLTLLGWYVKQTHGNMYQSGFPDLYICHSRYGTRWVDAKNPGHYSFTPAQLETWPKMCANGAGVWILISDDDSEIQKLFGPANWHTYLGVMR